GVNVVGWPFDRGHDVANAGEVEDELSVLEQRVIGVEFPDIALVEREPGLAVMLREVRLAAADEIVDHTHAIATREQQIDHVAADETGAAGDDGFALAHAACRFFMRRTL